MVDPRLVYIVCRGHSGSTLLELLLNRNKQVAAMGEVDLFPLQVYRDHRTRWMGVCSCGKRPMDCPVWGHVVRSIRSNFNPHFEERPFSWRISNTGLEEEHGWRRPLSKANQLLHRAIRGYASANVSSRLPSLVAEKYASWVHRRDFIAREFAHAQNAEVVVDSSKDPLQMLDLIRYSTLDIRILFMTRDPRGLAWSAVKRSRSVRTEIDKWVRLNKRILRALDHVDKSRWKQVAYESLCSDTERELSAIFRFIGVTEESVSSDSEWAKRHTIAGNRIRLQPLTSIEEDLGWHNHLTHFDLSTIHSRARHLAPLIGYALHEEEE